MENNGENVCVDTEQIDCLMYKFIFIRKLTPDLNTHCDSCHTTGQCFLIFFFFFLLKKIRLYNIECWKKKDVQKTDTILIIQRKNYTVSLHISTSTELVYNRLI